MRAMVAGTLVVLFIQVAPADEELDGLIGEYNKAQEAWFQNLEKFRKEDGSSEFKEGAMPPRPGPSFLPRFRAYAEQHAGKPEAIEALVWIMQLTPRPDKPGEKSADGLWAVEQLTRNHAADSQLGAHLANLRYSFYDVGKKPLIRFYKRVIEVNKDKETVATAMFNLALTLRSHGLPWDDAGADTFDRDRAATLFRRIVKEYPETPAGKQAKGYVFEIEHLQIGMQAPDFSGEDVDGNTIRLSQFRGQVVVLDFWGFW